MTSPNTDRDERVTDDIDTRLDRAYIAGVKFGRNAGEVEYQMATRGRYADIAEAVSVSRGSLFVECDTCRAKPGAPNLCSGCLHNRALINSLLNKQPIDQDRLKDVHDSGCLYRTHNGKCDCSFGSVINDAATRMRDRCVEKVKSMRDEWVKKLAETDDLLWNAWIDAANRIINQLESLTLEQGEQKQ